MLTSPCPPIQPGPPVSEAAPGGGALVPRSDRMREGHRLASGCAQRGARRDSTWGVALQALEPLQKPQAKCTSP